MLLASYKSTRSGWRGIANILIRWRLRGIYSHTEVVFEPGDGVESLMPDGRLDPVDGAFWCASSVAAEAMPIWSPKRAGKIGGVRFKRIALESEKWDVVRVPYQPIPAAQMAVKLQGALYDWQGIFGYLAWMIPDKPARYSCAEFAAKIFGFEDAWRFDPCVTHSVAKSAGKK